MIDASDDLFDLFSRDKAASTEPEELLEPYKIIISDDDEEVHQVTQLVLKNLKFEGRSMVFYHAYNEKETRDLLVQHPDTAILFQDVVMDTLRSGLNLVEYTRTVLGNRKTRIILRTGNPGDAPEERIVIDYDINDYKLKTELTHQKLLTTVYQSLRSFRDLMTLEKNRLGLEKIITASSELFQNDNIEDFFESILKSILTFYDDHAALLICENHVQNGFVLIKNAPQTLIVAATGRFGDFKGCDIEVSTEIQQIDQLIRQATNGDSALVPVYRGFVITQAATDGALTYIYVEGDSKIYDTQLISLFISNYTLALDRFYLHQKINKVQRGVIYNLSNIIENRSKETANHTVRVSELCDIFFKELGFDPNKREVLRIATSMHDIGKIGVPDAILLKPGRLTAAEFIEMQKHPLIAAQILDSTDLELFHSAQLVAKYHHEKFDGSGYPEGLIGEAIPIEARVLAIVDVFDALTHIRCYKDAWTIEAATNYIVEASGKHFDPALVTIFLKELDAIKEVFNLYPDKD